MDHVEKKTVIVYSPDGAKFNVNGHVVKDIFKEITAKLNVLYAMIYIKDNECPLAHLIPLIDGGNYFILIPNQDLTQDEQDKLNSEFFDSLIRYDFNEALNFLGKGANINMQHLITNIVQLYYINKKAINIDIVKLVIDYGANINIKNNCGNTPLHMCVDETTTELLLVNGADINAQNNNGFSVLSMAVLRNDIRIVKLLLQYKVKLNQLNCTNCNELHNVMNKDIAELLIQNGVLLNKKNNSNHTPLCYAIQLENIELVELFLAYNANIKDVAKHILDPNIYLSYTKKRKILQLLE